MEDENRPSQNVNNDCNNNNLSGGQIALIIIGCLLIIGVVAALIAWLMQDRKKSKSNSSKQQIVQLGGQFSPNNALQKQDTQNQQTPNTNQPAEPAKQAMPDYNENLNNQLINQVIADQMAMNQNNMVTNAQKPLYTIPENNQIVAEKPVETKKEEPKQDDLEDSLSEQSTDDMEEDIKQNDNEEKKDEKQEAKQSDKKTNAMLDDLLSGILNEKPVKAEANDIDGNAPATQNQNLQFPVDFTYTLKDFEKLAKAGKSQNPFQQVPLEKEIDNANLLTEQHKLEEEQFTNNKPLAQLGNAFSEPELKLKMQNPEENLPSPEQPISNKVNRELPTLDQGPMSINMPMMAPNTNNQDNVVGGGNIFNFTPKPQQNNIGANNNVGANNTFMQMGDGNNMSPKMNEIGANNNVMSMDDNSFGNNISPIFNFTPKPNNVNQLTNANEEPMQEGMSANAMFGEKPKEEQKPMTLNNLLGGMKFNRPANANEKPMHFIMDDPEPQMEKKNQIMNIGMDMPKQDGIEAQQQELNNQMLMNNGANMPIQQNKNDAGNIKPEPINEDDIKPDAPIFTPPMMNMENNNEDKHKMIEEDDIQMTSDGMKNPFMTQPRKEEPEIEEKEEIEDLPMPSQAIGRNEGQDKNDNKVDEGMVFNPFIKPPMPAPNIPIKKEINNSMLNGLPGINSNMPMEQTNNGQSQTNLETQNKCNCPVCSGK